MRGFAKPLGHSGAGGHGAYPLQISESSRGETQISVPALGCGGAALAGLKENVSAASPDTI